MNQFFKKLLFSTLLASFIFSSLAHAGRFNRFFINIHKSDNFNRTFTVNLNHSTVPEVILEAFTKAGVKPTFGGEKIQVMIRSEDELDQFEQIANKFEKSITYLETFTLVANPSSNDQKDTLKIQFQKFLKETKGLSDTRIENAWGFLNHHVFIDPLFYSLFGSINPDYISFWNEKLSQNKTFLATTKEAESDAISFLTKLKEGELEEAGTFLKADFRQARRSMIKRSGSGHSPLCRNELILPAEGTLSAFWLSFVDLYLLGHSLQHNAGDDNGLATLKDLIELEYLMSFIRDPQFQNDPKSYLTQLTKETPIGGLENTCHNKARYSAVEYLDNILSYSPEILQELVTEARRKYSQ